MCGLLQVITHQGEPEEAAARGRRRFCWSLLKLGPSPRGLPPLSPAEGPTAIWWLRGSCWAVKGLLGTAQLPRDPDTSANERCGWPKVRQ